MLILSNAGFDTFATPAPAPSLSILKFNPAVYVITALCLYQI